MVKLACPTLPTFISDFLCAIAEDGRLWPLSESARINDQKPPRPQRSREGEQAIVLQNTIILILASSI